MDRIEFLKRRKSFICGSDIAAIAGISPWKTPVDIYLDKINAEIPHEEISEAAHFGNLLEDVVAQEYSRRTGYNLEVEPNLLTNDKYPYVAANIDRWANNRQHVLEIKTTSFIQKDKWGEEGSDEIPEHYLCQVALYAAICDVPFVDICLLLGGQQLKIYKYTRNEILEQNLLTLAKNFWLNHVEKRIPPEAINLQDLSKLYPEAKDTSIEANEDVATLISNLNLLKSESALLEERIKQTQLAIQNYMGENSVLTDYNGNILATWKPSKPRNSFDSKALQKEMPDIYAKYLGEGKSYRTFLTKNKSHNNE